MKRYWTIALTALTVFLVAVAAWKMWPRTVPLEECSEIYQRYHDNPHVVASFLKDFRVNDTVTVDVTLLEAKDDEGWEELREMTGGFPLMEHEKEQLKRGNDIVQTWISENDSLKPSPNTDPTNNFFCVMSFLKRSILVCHIETEEQYRNIDLHYINQLKTKNNETKTMDEEKRGATRAAPHGVERSPLRALKITAITVTR